MNETQNAEKCPNPRITGACNGNHRICDCGCVHHPDLGKVQDKAAHRDELITQLSLLCLELKDKVEKLEQITAISARFR